MCACLQAHIHILAMLTCSTQTALQVAADGNEATANIAYLLSDVSFIYPITPSSAFLVPAALAYVLPGCCLCRPWKLRAMVLLWPWNQLVDFPISFVDFPISCGS